MLGDRLRGLRMTRGLSVREVARQTGLSPTLISQVERGITDPSLETLRKLTGVFGESMAALFVDSAAPSVSISRPGHRSLLRGPRNQISYERLTPGNGELEVLRTVLLPGRASSDQPWSHPSLECAYVITGEIVTEIGGVNYTVRAGESITFDSRSHHRYLNLATNEASAEIILAIHPPNP